MKNSLGVLLLLVILCLPALAAATGSSTAEIQIIPIAANEKGFVLCKTRSFINKMGGHGVIRHEYGWLVVNAHDLWKQVRHARVDQNAERSVEKLLARFDALEKAFNAKLNWQSPPASLKPLIRAYGFNKRHAVSENLGQGEIIWSPDAVFDSSGNRFGAVKQRTLGNRVSERSDGSRIEARFHYMGVAIFRNQCQYTPDGDGAVTKTTGADIRIANYTVYHDKNIGIDIWTIDGISMIRKKALNKKPNNGFE